MQCILPYLPTYMRTFLTTLLLIVFIGCMFLGCSVRKANNSASATDNYSSYKDSTLYGSHFPLMMPYNRLIDAVGKTMYFGDPAFENHSLDAALMPGNKLLAVEDRYGIAIIDPSSRSIKDRWTFNGDRTFDGLMSTYSGIKTVSFKDSTFIFWSAAGNIHQSYVMKAVWDGEHLKLADAISLPPLPPAPMALPNDLAIRAEGNELYIYVVLNGNNQLLKERVRDHQTVWTTPTGVAPFGIAIANNLAYVSNWGGTMPAGSTAAETAGVPYGDAYIDPKTGAISQGTVSVIDLATGKIEKEIKVGLHPNAVIASPDQKFVYVANGNSDNVSIIDSKQNVVKDSIRVTGRDASEHYRGSTPNALAINKEGTTLYVANGLDNAIAVIQLANQTPPGNQANLEGFIPTQAYPSGIVIHNNSLYVTNLEGIGAWVNAGSITEAARTSIIPTSSKDAFNSHQQLASVSFIKIPDDQQLKAYTEKVKRLNYEYRELLSKQQPRTGVAPQPVPERLGEPSLFKHVLYIIKENRTFDQVLGDMSEGRGMPSLCVFGNNVTPNQHQFARDFSLLDNYYVSGKSSAEGHQWTDAAMVTDYIEKNVRAWFRSYPHVQYDAMVYDKEGFIWNNALDHGKTVRIYGEASSLQYDRTLDWSKIYDLYTKGQSFQFTNTSTISRVRPILAQSYPGGGDQRINDQMRANAFINELKAYEKMPGDQLPNLLVMALPNDHTVGTAPGFPIPEAMVADNDLAVGRIIEALTNSRFWDSTVVFVTEDDSQAGWDHISAYRTTGFIISPYSRLQKAVHTNYNQTSVVRTIEQILGIPPMNGIDATAAPMFDCFTSTADKSFRYKAIRNKIPLNQMNKPTTMLKGKALRYALASQKEAIQIDAGDDKLLNKILWFATKGNKPYPTKFAGKDDDD
jgi:YVTN family beta-propeller protein